MKKLPEKPPDIYEEKILMRIAEVQKNPELVGKINEYNRRYLYWDELKYRISDPEERGAVWAVMKAFRSMGYDSVPYPCLNMKYSTTPGISRSLQIIDRDLSGNIGAFNRSLEHGHSYIRNSLMEEAIASSIIEGAATTRRAAKDMLRKGRKPVNRSEQMVINNFRAMQYIQERKDEPLTTGMILEIHRIVTENTLEDSAVGRFRSNDNIVVANTVDGLVYHTPPPYSEVPGMIEELCRFANTDDEATGNFIHPIIKGIILHFLVGYIHPFEDGNGRCARSIFYWYVLSRGYWLFEYMPISRIILRSKNDYALAYLHTEFDEMDLTYFILYNIRCMEEGRSDLISYLKRKQSEQKAEWALVREIPGIKRRQAEILREMMEKRYDYFTIREIMETCGVVYETARTDLMTLADLGYIKKEKRGREFVFRFNEESGLGG